MQVWCVCLACEKLLEDFTAKANGKALDGIELTVEVEVMPYVVDGLVKASGAEQTSRNLLDSEPLFWTESRACFRLPNSML